MSLEVESIITKKRQRNAVAARASRARRQLKSVIISQERDAYKQECEALQRILNEVKRERDQLLTELKMTKFFKDIDMFVDNVLE